MKADSWLYGLAVALLIGCATGGEDPIAPDAMEDDCPGDLVLCSGTCVDTQSDTAHCGACGVTCNLGEVCQNGSCTLMCAPGLINCDGVCTDPQTDPDHCGATGTCTGIGAGEACAPGYVCSAGQCELDCAPGLIDCDGSCIDPQTNADFCGASGDCQGQNSGVVCGPGASSCPGTADDVCVGGGCVPGCASGSETFDFTGAVETSGFPSCVTEVTVRAWGAQGGSSTEGSTGGLGGYVEGTVCVNPGTALSVLVGEQAASVYYPCGGGGGSYVATGNMPLFVAGGGGGGYLDWTPGGDSTDLSTAGAGVGGTSHNDGGGGGGFSTDGQGTQGSGGQSFLAGGAGGIEYPAGNTNASAGGFGGGGGASQSGTFNAGGGGGYNGGNAGNGNASTGGTSYITPGATESMHLPANRTGHGRVELSW